MLDAPRERILHHAAEEKCLAQHPIHCVSKPGIGPNLYLWIISDKESWSACSSATVRKPDWLQASATPTQSKSGSEEACRDLRENRVRFQLKTEIPRGRMMLLSQANRCRSQTHAWHPPTKHKIIFWAVKTSISITSAQLHHQKDHLVNAQLKQHTFYWESNSSSSSLTLYFKAKPEHYKKYLINNHNKLNSTSQTDIWPHLFEAGEEDKAAVPCGHFMWRDSLWNTMTQRSFKGNEKNPCSVCMLLKWQHTTDDVLQACKTI